MKVYKQWKLLFWLLLTAVSFQGFFMAKGIENVPFFLYHMFSTVDTHNDSLKVILIKTPDGYFNTNNLSGREREMLMNNAYIVSEQIAAAFTDPMSQAVKNRFEERTSKEVYEKLKEQLTNNDDNFKAYPGWWLRYFNQVQNYQFDSLSLVSTYIYLNPFVHKSEKDSIIFTAHNK